MAKMIVISEEQFDQLFERCLDKLKMSQTGVTASNVGHDLQRCMITEDMHRNFHFHVCRLKQEIKDSK